MNSIFILNVNSNPFLTGTENPVQKLLELCPTLEIINDVRR